MKMANEPLAMRSGVENREALNQAWYRAGTEKDTKAGGDLHEID